MKYTKLKTPQRTAIISAEPKGWGRSYQELHNQTDVSGWDLFLIESHGNFNNPFQKTMEEIYKQRGYFGLVLRDVVRAGSRGMNDRRRLNIEYVSHAGTKWEKTHNVWAPENGFWVPNDDCEKINGVVIPFQPGTLVPYETVMFKTEAKERMEKSGMNPEYASFFYRPDDYGSGRLAGRYFNPYMYGSCHFFVDLDWLRSDHFNRVASLPAYEEPQLLVEANAVQKNQPA